MAKKTAQYVGDGHILDGLNICTRCGACACCPPTTQLVRKCAGTPVPVELGHRGSKS